jgi:hypothetical protein
LGRLEISNIDGDTDADGDIDVPTMFGTRSFSIWNATSGALVFDSGSEIAEVTLTDSPDYFNANGSATSTDSRSDAKGAEPEPIVVGKVGDRTVAFVGMERAGGIVAYDITDPTNVMLADYVHTGLETGSSSPEGLAFVSSEMSVDGHAYLIVGYDGSSSLEVFRVVPEPQGFVHLWMLLGGVLYLRRRVG